jgi:hypothetical protein
VEEIFDLKDAKCTFDFVFQLYNFVSLAHASNNNLDDSLRRVVKLRSDVVQMGIPSLTSQKRKARGEDDAGDGPSKKPRNEGGHVESDVLSDVALLEALDRAGYTIPNDVEDSDVLLPVCVSFP